MARAMIARSSMAMREKARPSKRHEVVPPVATKQSSRAAQATLRLRAPATSSRVRSWLTAPCWRSTTMRVVPRVRVPR
jgi:hypothetical protein